MTTKKIGLLGHGTIGSEVLRMLHANQDRYEQHIGWPLAITRVGVKRPSRHPQLSRDIVTTDIDSIVDDPSLDLVIAVMGDEECEYKAIYNALLHGKKVVTANKKVLANHWSTFAEYIFPFSGHLLCEAAVCAGIQITDNLLNRYLPVRFNGCDGVVNGTTNYMFTQMRDSGISFGVALRDAQKRGYAEPDPTDDIDGYDAAYKLSILTSLAFGNHVHPVSISRQSMRVTQGLRAIKQRDWFYANKLGGTFRMIASARVIDDTIHPWVAPAFVPQHHILRSVDGVLNGLYLTSEELGETGLIGRGAGPKATATSIWSDVLCALGQGRTLLERNFTNDHAHSEMSVAPADDCASCHYIRMTVRDEPGVLGSIGTIFGKRRVSIEQFHQPPEGKFEDGIHEMIMLTEPNKEKHFAKALQEVRRQPYCLKISTVLRAIN